ncbi:MAG: hypothetical protein E8F57_02120 [Methylophaga nitratireducenticrescens]|uniref:hypothetical protein n=1 Tax=Methylophaga sp. SB9B TaxID=2570356 RepID=UPI0010A76D03|nr:hypothetical protein [Methylophaga sp. SB9B]THF71296.1 MAG: hypothetical protein E8F57_02120 [Methylophaga nitratireducenticrescens]THK40858.1 hypothetical protein E8Q33_11245 [Methylophaga sp. SB9B]
MSLGELISKEFQKKLMKYQFSFFHKNNYAAHSSSQFIGLEDVVLCKGGLKAGHKRSIAVYIEHNYKLTTL